jgi:hypothetical protein
MKGIRNVALTVALAAALVLPGPARAQSADAWQFGAVVYGWFPSVKGRTTFPQDSGTDVSVDADTILENLKFVFMGTLEARRQRYGFFTDVIYMDIGDSKSGTRDLTIGGFPIPGTAEASARYDLKALVWTLAGSYRMVADPGATLDVFAGARMADVEQEFDWSITGDAGPIPLPARSGSARVSKTNWDGIVGMKGRMSFGHERRWFVPYYLDVGTGDSDLTWQGMGGLGYSFRWGDVVASWRYLDYDFKNSSKVQDLNFSGPQVGVVLRW